MTDEEIIDYVLSILKGSKKEAVQMRGCIAKTAICQRLNASIEFMQKLNTRLARLKGFENGEVAWQGDMDATIKQNLELKEQNKAILEDNDELNKWIDELKAQIEEMKNLYKEGIPEDKDRLCIFYDGEYYIDTFNNLSSSEQKQLIKWCYLQKITER